MFHKLVELPNSYTKQVLLEMSLLTLGKLSSTALYYKRGAGLAANVDMLCIAVR